MKKLSKIDDHLGENNGKDNIELKIKNFYNSYFSIVKQYIISNSGELEDAKDLFQEVVLVYFKMLNKPERPIIENEKNYILGIAKNIWLKKLKDNKKLKVTHHEQVEEYADINVNLPEIIHNNAMLDLILVKLNEISEECKKIIHAAFYLKLSGVEIAVQTGYSEQFIKVKKYRCLQGLKKIVSNSQEFKNLQF
ncbi:MAG: sigma-70 family RNA polymerase sigma factor [Saprospiraceae bacterium]